MKNQRQLNLNDEETHYIMERLTEFSIILSLILVNNHTVPVYGTPIATSLPTSFVKENHKKIVEELVAQPSHKSSVVEVKSKTSVEVFSKKYEKILAKAKKLLNFVEENKDNV